MPKTCTYTIGGNTYSESEFKSHLLDGALDSYAKEGLVALKGLEVEKKTPTRKDVAKGLMDLLNKGKEKLALEGDVNPKTRRTFEQLGIKEGDTIQNVVDRLIEEGGEYADLLRAIRADENFRKLTAEFIDEKKGGDNGESGLYYPTENRLQIWNKDNVKYTIAHELMHWLTLDSRAAENVKETDSYKAIDDLYNYLSAKKGKPVMGLATIESYGLTNVKEFMAELLINPNFRDYVSDVFAESKEDILKTSKFIKDTKDASIIKMIADFFKDLFNSLVRKDQSIPFDEKKSVVDNSVNLMKDLFFSNKYTNLEKTSQNADDFITGKKVFERFSQEEQRGFAEGGTSHVEASILLAANEGAGREDNSTTEAQENRVEEYAKEKGIWVDDTSKSLTDKYGDPIASGEEAIVWGDPENGKVIKTQDTFQYENLQEKLDGITLHNTYFPEASIKVIGFGRNSNGEFQVIVEQPFIQGEKLTKKEIDEYLTNLGFTEDDNGHFSNDQTIIEDVHTGNAIKDKDGNIIVIDPIMRLNTPEQGYGGKRNINQNKPLAYPSQFNKEELDPITKAYVKQLVDQEVDEKIIRDGLVDFGFTKDEAQDIINEVKPKPKVRVVVGKEEKEGDLIDDYEMKTSGEINQMLSGSTIEGVFGEAAAGEQDYEVQKLTDMLQDGRNMIQMAEAKWGTDVLDYGKPLFEYVQEMSNDKQLTNKKAVLLATFLGELKDAIIRETERAGEIKPLYNAVENYYQLYMNKVGKELAAGRLLRLYRDKYLGDVFADKILEEAQIKEKRKLQEAESKKKIDDETAAKPKNITKEQKDEQDKADKDTSKKAQSDRGKKKKLSTEDAKKMAQAKMEEIKERAGDQKGLIDKINDAIKKLNCK